MSASRLLWTFCAVFSVIHFRHGAGQFDEEEEEQKPPDEDMVKFAGGQRFMGVNDPRYAHIGEHPMRFEEVKSFMIDRFPVTNAQFARFVEDTRYARTEADMKTWSLVFMGHETPNAQRRPKETEDEELWWRKIYLARWNAPYGPGSSIENMANYPVVHVSVGDAAMYCEWVNKRLPTEYEWEYAARLNDDSWTYPWGHHFRANRMNTWQGFFPTEDEGHDGYTGLSPVDAYRAQNTVGMRDMLGNVWEWTSTVYRGDHAVFRKPWERLYTLKGGSFIDSHEGDGDGHRIVRSSTRMGQPESYTAENVGFRCAKDYKEEKEVYVHRYEDTYEYRQEMKKLKERYEALKAKSDRDKKNLRASKEL